MLATNCSTQGVVVDFDKLYSGVDPDYELCLRVVVDRVHAVKAEAADS